ncbi:MAG: hypothetical protein IOB81_05940 [Burkholderia sp.]|nr:hypothetical protein [Burkholderia sp.]
MILQDPERDRISLDHFALRHFLVVRKRVVSGVLFAEVARLLADRQIAGALFHDRAIGFVPHDFADRDRQSFELFIGQVRDQQRLADGLEERETVVLSG